MADDNQPERILQTAIAFYKVQQILKKKTPDDHDEGVALTLTICLLQALTSELLLKCLIRIEGGTPPREHDLLCLFNLLSAPTRERVEAMWRDYVQHRVEAFRQDGMMIEPELTAALAAGRKGFEVIRYWHEEPDEDCAFYLTALPNKLFEVAFELRPDWAP